MQPGHTNEQARPDHEADRPSHLTVVLDRSGSMQAMRDDAIGGFNAFVERQRAEPGEATLTLAQFDHEYEVVLRGVPLRDVPELTAASFQPRGQTALYDAIGRAIDDTLLDVSRVPEAQRPDVIVAILTDGEENASVELSHPALKRRIEAQSAMGWEFVFLAANVDVARASARMGFRPDKSRGYDGSKEGMRRAFDMMSEEVTDSRNKKRRPPSLGGAGSAGDAGGSGDAAGPGSDPPRSQRGSGGPPSGCL
jgi:hypothetical protein